MSRPSTSALIDAAEDGAHRAAALTRQLLAFAKQQSLAPSVFAPAELVDSMLELIRRSLGEQVEVSFEGGDDSWNVLADRAQLENTILNLAINARDAMPEGGKLRLAIDNQAIDQDQAASLDLKAGQYVCITVNDTGTGMSEDVASKVFEPFFTTKEVGKGTGLGLSQVFGFIQQSKGQISLETELGQGTTFRLFLPRSSSVQATESTPLPVSDLEPGNGELVLLVEDDHRLRSFTDEALREIGYTVVSAGTAAEALGVIAGGQRPDLVLTDIVMPGQSGLVLAEKVRENDPGAKVLFMSGYAQKQAREDETIADGNLLKKPFTLEELARHVSSALSEPTA